MHCQKYVSIVINTRFRKKDGNLYQKVVTGYKQTEKICKNSHLFAESVPSCSLLNKLAKSGLAGKYLVYHALKDKKKDPVLAKSGRSRSST